MSTRERREERQGGNPGDSPDASGAGNLGLSRRQGDDLLAAADEAINRALSGDSEAFLAANRQMGGE